MRGSKYKLEKLLELTKNNQIYKQSSIIIDLKHIEKDESEYFYEITSTEVEEILYNFQYEDETFRIIENFCKVLLNNDIIIKYTYEDKSKKKYLRNKKEIKEWINELYDDLSTA